VRIAIFTETFLPKVDGVVTRLVHTLDALQELGHEVLVLAPPAAPDRYGRYAVVAAPGLPFPWYPELKVALPSTRLAAAAAAFDPDVVHVVNPVVFGSWGALWARRRRLPLVASFHTDPKVVRRLGLGWLERPLEIVDREVHNLADVTLCTSPQMVELARGLHIRRVRLWPKAVDSRRFDPGKATQAMRARLCGGEPERPLVVYAGRVSFEKRVDVLADAVRRLPGVRFAVVGEGPALDWLQRELSGTDTVFTGFLEGDELSAAYASGDLFAFPSDSETLGFAAIEAMAAGVCVVAARAGGIPHIVRDGDNGVLVEPGEGAALARALRELIDDPDRRRRIAERGRRDSLLWSWEGSTRTLVEFYERALRLHGSWPTTATVPSGTKAA
jgi:glycosyltransferase involved in cell wall biosynthesis